ncbi:hypothetical protein [Citricoccus sp. I39-566]|uniref:hypothetical protein n=1 Tax=Citricoccus sp. I39-566 TaxID=3073268 RepID=UPI00286B3B6F|nr:hypothetical protein [Citricoccus sp. I39-566]WMY79411.1 hypothetical protein RE421_05980 [Citricoccus sp. I39-566]
MAPNVLSVTSCGHLRFNRASASLQVAFEMTGPSMASSLLLFISEVETSALLQLGGVAGKTMMANQKRCATSDQLGTITR